MSARLVMVSHVSLSGHGGLMSARLVTVFHISPSGDGIP